MQIRRLDAQFEQQLGLKLSRASFRSYKDSLELQDFELNCQRQQQFPDPMDQAIAGCLQRLTARSAKFSQSLVPFYLESVFEEPLMGTDVSKLDLRITNGAYNLSADVKAQLSGKVTSKGSVIYDAQKKLLTINVSEVKFGLLNLTNQVFDELKKNESDKFKVKRPFLYLTVK
jgi:hypothetical protein